MPSRSRGSRGSGGSGGKGWAGRAVGRGERVARGRGRDVQVGRWGDRRGRGPGDMRLLAPSTGASEIQPERELYLTVSAKANRRANRACVSPEGGAGGGRRQRLARLYLVGLGHAIGRQGVGERRG